MTRRLPEPALFVLLWGPLAILHVPEVVFTPLLVRVLVDKVVLIGQLQHDREESQQGKHDIVVQRLGKDFNVCDVSLEQIWLVIRPANYRQHDPASYSRK